MRSTARWLVFAIALGGLMVTGVPGSADHATRSDVRNIVPIADLTNTDTFAN